MINVARVSTYTAHSWYSILATVKQQKHVDWLNFIEQFSDSYLM